MTTSSNDELALKDLSYGFMNPIADGRTGNSTDRRRSDFNTWLRASIDEVYKTKALQGVGEFQGIVLQVSEKESSAAGDREAVLAQFAKRRWYQLPRRGSSDAELRPVCKVLIPELECRPVPYGFDDPVITTYYDTYLASSADSWTNKPLLGSIVTVKFGNITNFSDPRITRIGKQIAFHGENPTGNTDAGRNNPSAPAANQSGGPTGPRRSQGARTTTPESCPEATQKKDLSIPSVRLKGKLNFEDLKKLKRGPFTQTGFLDWIGKGEGNVNSVNRGIAGDSPLSGGSYVVSGPLRGKILTDLTVAEVYSLQEGRVNGQRYVGANARHVKPKSDGVQRGFLAVGKMQFIPNTFNSVLVNTRVDRQNTKFDEETQLVLGVYLILGGQGGRLGTYLLGYHDNVGAAGQNLAEIWASVPVQFTAPNGCRPGYSRYCVGGANSSRPLRKSTCEVVEQLKKLKEAIKNDSQSVALVENKAPGGSFTA